MRKIVGTSGYSYKEWKGSFYPDDLPAAKMLAYYAARFGSVEINNTFYRMPEAKTLEKWAGQVPHGFTFVLKVPGRITQRKDLSGVGPDVLHFLSVAAVLGDKLGPLLVNLPGSKNLDKLRTLLALIPPGPRVALDVRGESWADAEVYAVLREHDAAFCASDTDEVTDPDALLVPTASWGYLRLRRADYSDAELAAWHERIEARNWPEAYVFFKHEDEGKGPLFANRFLALSAH